MTDRGLHGEPTTHGCEVCGEQLARADVVPHLRLFHPDRWDDVVDRPADVEAA